MLVDEVYEAFLDYSEKSFMVESVRFMRDALQWKLHFFEISADLQILRAKRISRYYLTRGSDLEINVSHSAREAVDRRLASNSIYVDLFDKTLAEVTSLLKYTAWVDFQHEHGVLLERQVSVKMAQP